MIRFPLQCVHALPFLLEEMGIDQTNPTFWGLQEWFRRARSIVLPPLNKISHDIFCSPIAVPQNCCTQELSHTNSEISHDFTLNQLAKLRDSVRGECLWGPQGSKIWCAYMSIEHCIAWFTRKSFFGLRPKQPEKEIDHRALLYMTIFSHTQDRFNSPEIVIAMLWCIDTHQVTARLLACVAPRGARSFAICSKGGSKVCIQLPAAHWQRGDWETSGP